MRPMHSSGWEALQNRDYLPLKHRVTRYIEDQLLATRGPLTATLKKPSGDFLPSPIRGTSGRLSRGEAYLEQPYRVFDMPRYFGEGHIFLFRSLVLWGHHLSFHLILTGNFAASLGPIISAQRHELHKDWLLATQDSPWVWDRSAEGWHDLATMTDHTIQQLSEKVPYCKVSRFYPLTDAAALPELAAENWEFWQEWLASKGAEISLPQDINT